MLPKSDSLAFAFLLSTDVIAAVIAGRNMNEMLELCWRQNMNLTPASRGATQDMVYGALRRYGRGDFLLSKLFTRPNNSSSNDPRIRALLLAALYRLADRIEDAHTTVDQAVSAAASIARGQFKGLVNAVLRNYLRRFDALNAEADQDEIAYFQYPAWWMSKLRVTYPDCWENTLAMGNSHPPMSLRVNIRRIQPIAYLQMLNDNGIEAQLMGELGNELGNESAIVLARPCSVDRLPGFFEGLVSVQDVGAQKAAILLDIKGGMRVLDACAAPGGKAAHMLEIADVDLLALDINAKRIHRINENFTRLGLQAKVCVADCRNVKSWWDGKLFDRVLADVPCSASGVVRRHPDIKWLRRDSDIPYFAAEQVEILSLLWQVLAPGGKLLYATCSLFAEENDGVISNFMNKHEDCTSDARDIAFMRQCLPSDTQDGFFYACLSKRA